jgi:transcriptional regulator with XRE-family HTH domain
MTCTDLDYISRGDIARRAAAAGVPVARVLAAESGGGVLELDDLERLARVLGVKVGELFRPLGRRVEEKMLLSVLEGGGRLRKL